MRKLPKKISGSTQQAPRKQKWEIIFTAIVNFYFSTSSTSELTNLNKTFTWHKNTRTFATEMDEQQLLNIKLVFVPNLWTIFPCPMHIINLRLVEIVFQHFFARMQRSFLELQTVPVAKFWVKTGWIQLQTLEKNF